MVFLKILKMAFIAWIVLWLFFVTRELFIKGELSDYKALVLMSFEEKRSYVTGSRFYEFLSFANENLPKSANYILIGPEEGSIEKRRAVYYLYPHLETEGANFMLIFDRPRIPENGYEMFAKLDEARYILKKKEAR